MHRKNFIKSCGILCMGGTAVAALLESCGTPLYFAQTSIDENKLAIKKSEFISVVKEKTSQRKFVLVKHEKLQYPICIYRHNENEFTALYTECTHRGCELKPNGEYLVCPCHGSEFTNKGVVQNPPAETNLKQFAITTDDENIFIQL